MLIFFKYQEIMKGYFMEEQEKLCYHSDLKKCEGSDCGNAKLCAHNNQQKEQK